MYKRITASILTAISLITMFPRTTLAERAVNYRYHKKFYPDTCIIKLQGEKYGCDYTVIGAFDDASANFKLCSELSCLILILSPTQLANIADEEDFSVRQIAWQKGNRIAATLDVSMKCGFRRQAMVCAGELDSGNEITIYVE